MGDDDYSGGGGGGCGCASTTTMSARGGAFDAGPGSAPTATSTPPPPPPVQIVDQAVVGPYETVTVRSTQPDELEKWLREHGYAIPPSSSPIIASYVKEGFDFIALRLRPSSDVRAMQPIRIVSPGTDTSLPLRLMQIGAGTRVGITLYLLGEGRYRTASFPEVPIDLAKLIWDRNQNRSNYQALAQAAMATENGRAFITEYADHPSFDPRATGIAGMTSNPGLVAAYAITCPTYGQPRPPAVDAGVPDAGGRDGGDPDASADLDAAARPDSGLDPDAGVDAGGADAGPPREVQAYCDDIDVAFEGMTRADAWVTRMRANLPNAALDDTLRVEASPLQQKVDNIHQTTATGTVTAQIAPARAPRTTGTFAVIGLTVFALTRIVRRRAHADATKKLE